MFRLFVRSDMTDRNKKKRRSLAIVIPAIAFGLAVAAIGIAVALFSRYVKTEDTDSATAAHEFEAARARFAGRVPLVEYRGLQTPIVRRDPSTPRHQIVAVRALVYSATEGYLRRVNVPMRILRLITTGGRLSLMDLGMFGDDRDRITLEDLERHGPGLVLDTGGGSVGFLAVSDALLGTTSKDSRLLMWSE
jgi:hypothetical protein